jgi:hypothetical protein
MRCDLRIEIVTVGCGPELFPENMTFALANTWKNMP